MQDSSNFEFGQFSARLLHNLYEGDIRSTALKRRLRRVKKREVELTLLDALEEPTTPTMAPW